jgi:hypothetical protein
MLASLSFVDALAGPQATGKPNPLAPSLRELTNEEEQRTDQIIDRFIDYDTGKLRGPEAKQALTDFNKLGPDAIPALIRGLNRAARIDHSCPAVTIAKKLGRMLSATRDAELLEYARENIGAGVTQSKHMGVIKDLRVLCIVRKRAVAQYADSNPPTLPEPQTSPGLEALGAAPKQKPVRDLTLAELAEAAVGARGLRLRLVLEELGRRSGDTAIDALALAAGSNEGDMKKLARDVLTKQLTDLAERKLTEKLKDDRAEVRMAAARVVSNRGLHRESQLIDLLGDEDGGVRDSARQALVRLSKGNDFGPKSDASRAERDEAVQKWRRWLANQSGR